MSLSSLPPSEPRCWDSKCQAREACRRWLDRDEHARWHFGTIKPLWHCHQDPCPHHLAQENDNAESS